MLSAQADKRDQPGGKRQASRGWPHYNELLILLRIVATVQVNSAVYSNVPIMTPSYWMCGYL